MKIWALPNTEENAISFLQENYRLLIFRKSKKSNFNFKNFHTVFAARKEIVERILTCA